MPDQAPGGLLQIVLALGGWAVITSAVAVWISRLLAERLSIRWQQGHNVALERIRADIAREHAVLSTAITSFSAGQAAANERRLRAIEELWKAVLRLRERTPAILTLVDILQDSEYGLLFTKAEFVHERKKLTLDHIVEISNYASGKLEEHRPFVGELLWAFFSAYRAFVLRAMFLVHSATQAKGYQHWCSDEGIQQMLAAVMSESELQPLLVNPFGRLEAVRSAIERQMLGQAAKIITGEAAGELGLSQAARIQQAALAVQMTVP